MSQISYIVTRGIPVGSGPISCDLCPRVTPRKEVKFTEIKYHCTTPEGFVYLKDMPDVCGSCIDEMNEDMLVHTWFFQQACKKEWIKCLIRQLVGIGQRTTMDCSENIWTEERFGVTEVNLKNECRKLRINVGTDFDYIEIDKLYGPMGGEEIRIFLEDYHWVIKRLNNTTDEWEEKARWFIQESYTDNK